MAQLIKAWGFKHSDKDYTAKHIRHLVLTSMQKLGMHKAWVCMGSLCLTVRSFLWQGEEEKGKENKPEDEEKEESSEVWCWCECFLVVVSSYS